jgi:hypothetical protein
MHCVVMCMTNEKHFQNISTILSSSVFRTDESEYEVGISCKICTQLFTTFQHKNKNKTNKNNGDIYQISFHCCRSLYNIFFEELNFIYLL